MGVPVFSKTIGELRDIARGDPITARMLNEPRRAINTMLRGAEAPRQIISAPRPSAGEPAIAVVLVEAPSLPDPPEEEGSSILKIRRVKYEAEPPVPEQYAWDGEAFDAYPAFGLTVGDFVGLEWPFSARLPNAKETVFLKARLVSGSWLLDWPAPVVAQFRFDELSAIDGLFVARTWDGVNEGSERISIAMPWLLREGAHGTRNGITYQYFTQTRRRARISGGSEFEFQVITPSYVQRDTIVATRPIMRGIGLPPFPGQVGTIWLDNNLAGRAWAREFDVDEASA